MQRKLTQQLARLRATFARPPKLHPFSGCTIQSFFGKKNKASRVARARLMRIFRIARVSHIPCGGGGRKSLESLRLLGSTSRNGRVALKTRPPGGLIFEPVFQRKISGLRPTFKRKLRHAVRLWLHGCSTQLRTFNPRGIQTVTS